MKSDIFPLFLKNMTKFDVNDNPASFYAPLPVIIKFFIFYFPVIVDPKPENSIKPPCRKRCDLRNFQRKFCLSNFGKFVLMLLKCNDIK